MGYHRGAVKRFHGLYAAQLDKLKKDGRLSKHIEVMYKVICRQETYQAVEMDVLDLGLLVEDLDQKTARPSCAAAAAVVIECVLRDKSQSERLALYAVQVCRFLFLFCACPHPTSSHHNSCSS